MAGASDPRVRMLSAYRDTTRKMLQLLNTPEEGTELIDVEGFDQLLLERDQLIASHAGQSLPETENPLVENLVREIRQLESSVRHQLQSLQGTTSQKLKGFQGQKRGMAAYQNDYQVDAAFIDHRSK